jgi:hypothetical protein
MLIYANSRIWVKASNGRRLSFDVAYSFCLVIPQRLSKRIVVLERNDGFGQLVEVPSEDIGSIVYCIASPIETLTPSGRRVKGYFQLFDSLLGASKAEYTLDVGRWNEC